MLSPIKDAFIDYLRDYETGGCLGQAGVRRSPRGAEKVFLGGLWRQQWRQDWYQRGITDDSQNYKDIA